MLFVFSFPSVCYLCSCACKMYKVLKVRKAKVHTNRSSSLPLNHCTWNTSLAVPPLIPWLCDVTLCHHITHLHYLCVAASLAHENYFNTAALWLLAVLGQACVSWPIREDWVFKRGGLKEIGAKTERFSQRGEYRAAALDSMRNWHVLWALKHVHLF